MDNVNESSPSLINDQIKEASNLYDKKVSKYIQTIIIERTKIKSKSQKTAFLSVILSSFFIFDLIPCLLPTILLISIEPFSSLYQAIIWPILSRQQKMYLYSLRVCVRIPFIIKTTPIVFYFLQWIFWGISNSAIAYRIVFFAWFLSFTVFFLIIPWRISKYLLKNNYYQKNILNAHY